VLARSGERKLGRAESIVAIASAGVAAVLSATGRAPDRQLGSITMHLTPEQGAIADVTSKFVKIDMSPFGGGAPASLGFSVYREEFLCVVDRSAAFPNSLFVRWDRWFKGNTGLDELARQLNSDETKLLDRCVHAGIWHRGPSERRR